MLKIPRHVDVYTNLKGLIREGEIDIGDYLPTEGELEKQYDVSRTTVRRAIQTLVSEGYIEVKQGRGTKVLDFHSTQKLNCVTSISETLRQRGFNVETKSIYVEKMEALKSIADKLKIKKGSEIYRIQRVILADSVPTAILENFISKEITPNLDLYTHEIVSLYAFLKNKYSINIDSAKDIISAKSADFVESQMLDTKIGAALITLRRVTFFQNRPITYDNTIVRADKYQFEIMMQGRK